MIRQVTDKIRRSVMACITWLARPAVVIAAYEILRRYTNRISEGTIRQNAAHARTVLLGGCSGHIEDQAQWSQVRYGSGKGASMSRSGCGVIAVYNALAALGERMSADTMTALISDFERDGAAWNGALGTSPRAIYDHVRRRGYEAVFFVGNDPERIDKIGARYDVFIVTVYNDRTDLSSGLHTVCMTREHRTSGSRTGAAGQGAGFVIHNGYRRDPDGGWAAYMTGEEQLAAAAVHIGARSAVLSVTGILKKI